jgi:hypothetical protein
VTVGGTSATNIVFVSSSKLMCNTPAHVEGVVHLKVTNPDAQSDILFNGFTFIDKAWLPPPRPPCKVK